MSAKIKPPEYASLPHFINFDLSNVGCKEIYDTLYGAKLNTDSLKRWKIDGSKADKEFTEEFKVRQTLALQISLAIIPEVDKDSILDLQIKVSGGEEKEEERVANAHNAIFSSL